MILTLKRTPGIYLVGFMGSGKSTVGRKLAERIGWPFHDLDSIIEGAQGRTIAAIFEQDGEPAFREVERGALWEQVRRIERGEPPKRPTPIVRMRIASDLPEAERPKIEVMKSDSPAFLKYLKEAGYVDDTGFVKDLCDIKPPRRIKGQIQL